MLRLRRSHTWVRFRVILMKHELENGNCGRALQLQGVYCSLDGGVPNSHLSYNFHIEAQAEYNGKLGVLPIPHPCEVDTAHVLVQEFVPYSPDNISGLPLCEFGNISFALDSLCYRDASFPVPLLDVFAGNFVFGHDISLDLVYSVHVDERLAFSCSSATILAYTKYAYLLFLDRSYDSLWLVSPFKFFVGVGLT